MATTTTNLALIKPAGTDYVLVSDFNSNADVLDAAIGDLDALQTTEKSSLVGAINDAYDSVSTTVNVGTTTTGAAGTNASVTNVGTDKDAVFNFTIPRGQDGASGTIDGTTATTFTGILKGNGSTVGTATAGSDYLAPVGSAVAGNFAALNASGAVTDSGHKHSDYAVAASGVPTGGTVGQAVVKASATDYDFAWGAVGRANVNLLHNWDWVTPINQRAATGAVADAYCIDRWIGNGTVTPSAGNYVTLTNATTMTQRMEILPAKLFSKTYTVSIEIAGVIQSAALTFPSSASGSAVSQTLTGVTVEIGFVNLGNGNTSSLEGIASQYVPYIEFTATADINVTRLKLEYGSVSTLAHSGVEPMVSRLAACQRYFELVLASNNLLVGDANQLFGVYYQCVPKRLDTATVTLTSATYAHGMSTGSTAVVTVWNGTGTAPTVSTSLDAAYSTMVQAAYTTTNAQGLYVLNSSGTAANWVASRATATISADL